MNTYTKWLRIGTQQYSTYIYCQCYTVCFTSNDYIIFYVTTKDVRKSASKKQNLEHNCVLKTVDVGWDLLCVSSEVTAQEIVHIFVFYVHSVVIIDCRLSTYLSEWT